MDLVFRRASAEDVQIISEITARSWKTAYSGFIQQEYLDSIELDFWVGALTTWMQQKNLFIDLALINSKPVGAIIYRKAKWFAFGSYGEIMSLYLDPDYYHQGIGSALLNHGIEEMKKIKYRGCQLWILKGNDAGISFFKKHGFLPTKKASAFKLAGQPMTDLKFYKMFV